MNGHIYILSNKAKPGVIKIGTGVQAVKALDSADIIEYRQHVEDCAEVESELFRMFNNRRINDGILFELSAQKAIDALKQYPRV